MANKGTKSGTKGYRQYTYTNKLAIHETGGQIDRQIDRQMDGWMDGQIDRQIDRDIDRYRYRYETYTVDSPFSSWGGLGSGEDWGAESGSADAQRGDRHDTTRRAVRKPGIGALFIQGCAPQL